MAYMITKYIITFSGSLKLLLYQDIPDDYTTHWSYIVAIVAGELLAWYSKVDISILCELLYDQYDSIALAGNISLTACSI